MLSNHQMGMLYITKQSHLCFIESIQPIECLCMKVALLSKTRLQCEFRVVTRTK